MISLNKLKNIDTPARYTGGEARQYIKNSAMVSKRICVAAPAMYEFGMFDFDVKDIYYTLNNVRDIWCERAFAPMPDFEKLLRDNDEPLYTLESKTPLRNMDAIVFVISSELMYISRGFILLCLLFCLINSKTLLVVEKVSRKSTSGFWPPFCISELAAK